MTIDEMKSPMTVHIGRKRAGKLVPRCGAKKGPRTKVRRLQPTNTFMQNGFRRWESVTDTGVIMMAYGENLLCRRCLASATKPRKRRRQSHRDASHGLEEAERMAREWERKLTIAMTNFKKYQRKVRYYMARIERENKELRKQVAKREKKPRRIRLDTRAAV